MLALFGQRLDQHRPVKLQHWSCVHLKGHVDQAQLRLGVARDEAFKDLLAQEHVVLAVISQLLLDLRVDLIQAVRAVHSAPLLGQTEVCGQLGKAVAHLYAAQGACHRQGVEDEAGVHAVAPLKDRHIELGIVRKHSGLAPVVGCQDARQLVAVVPLHNSVTAVLMDASAERFEPLVADVLLCGQFGQRVVALVPARLEVNADDGLAWCAQVLSPVVVV